MIIEDGARLRAEWAAKGNPPCSHKNLSIERNRHGYLTGAYVCTECGELFKIGELSSEASEV